MSGNPNPWAFHLLERYPENINWNMLSTNPQATHLLEDNIEKINWYLLSKNPGAADLIKNNMDNVDFDMLSENPSVMEIICELDYDAMKMSMQPIAEELVAYVFNPSRMNIIAKRNNIPCDVLITEVY